MYAAAVGAYFKSGQLAPIDLIVEERFHRAAPGGTGGTKVAGNYSPVRPGRPVFTVTGPTPHPSHTEPRICALTTLPVMTLQPGRMLYQGAANDCIVQFADLSAVACCYDFSACARLPT